MDLEKNLKFYNSYRLNSSTTSIFLPKTVSELLEILSSRQKVIAIGGGYNIILRKPFYSDPFLVVSHNLSGIESLGKDTYKVLAGTSLKDISSFALDQSFEGFEVYFDIPGTLGGGLFMNAGTGETQLGDLIEAVEVYDRYSNKIFIMKASECNFSYRNSMFQTEKNLFILAAIFKFSHGNRQNIKEKMLSMRDIRHSKQPTEFPNAGSVFRRPHGYFVGTMIEKLGLKGMKMGGAMISEKHAGFIVNYADATGDDIVNLISVIRDRVFKEFNLYLQLEQVVIE